MQFYNGRTFDSHFLKNCQKCDFKKQSDVRLSRRYGGLHFWRVFIKTLTASISQYFECLLLDGKTYVCTGWTKLANKNWDEGFQRTVPYCTILYYSFCFFNWFYKFSP